MENYVALALCTESQEHFEPPYRLLHSTMGILTEIIELGASANDVNYKEELGDILWYIAVGADTLEVTLDELEEIAGPVSEEDPFVAMLELGGELLNLCKRHIYYGLDIPLGTFTHHLARLFSFFLCELDNADLRLDEVQASNIAKLEARYAGKFSKQAAVERDYTVEEAALTQ